LIHASPFLFIFDRKQKKRMKSCDCDLKNSAIEQTRTNESFAAKNKAERTRKKKNKKCLSFDFGPKKATTLLRRAAVPIEKKENRHEIVWNLLISMKNCNFAVLSTIEIRLKECLQFKTREFYFKKEFL
jgi:hypothetical protein